MSSRNTAPPAHNSWWTFAGRSRRLAWSACRSTSEPSPERRTSMKPWHIIGSLALAFASPAVAADEPGAANREAMKKVAFLAGKWAGEAKVQTGKGAVKTIQQTEDIRFRLNGVVLLIEGTGIGKLPDSDKEGVVFGSLATLSYDTESKKFLLRAYTMDGNMVDPEVTVSESGVVWQFTPVKTKVQV